MGVDVHVLRFLLRAKQNAVSFRNTLMIGRQNYYNLDVERFHLELSRAKFAGSFDDSKKIYGEEQTAKSYGRLTFIEPLLAFLGAAQSESMDCASFENASLIHDLNVPIPDSLKDRYSCVFDGGSIEHVFNFPQAMKNLMEMVAPGGHLLQVTTANNFLGHGFYQFSPELFFRVLSEQNGFAVEEMILCETDLDGRWYAVADPNTLGRRVELVNTRPTYIMVRARRVAQCKVFDSNPMQSDYVQMWSRDEPYTPQSGRALWLEAAKRFLPGFIRKTLRPLRGPGPWSFRFQQMIPAMITRAIRPWVIPPASFETDTVAFREIRHD